MKVLVVHNRYQQAGGEDSVVKHEIEMLQQHNISVELLAQDNDDIHTPLAKIQAAFSSIYSFQSRELLSRKILAFSPDVVHVHNFFPKFSPSIYDACAQRRVPVVQTLHNYRIICPKAILFRDGKPCTDCVGLPFAWPAIRHGCYRGSRPGSAAVAASFGLSRHRHVWRTKVSRFIALTEFSKRKFVEGGVPEAKIDVKSNSTLDLGIGTHDGSFSLYVGRLTEEKGIRVLLAAAQAGLVGPLKVVGDGPLRADVQRLHDAGKLEWLRQCPRASVTAFMKTATCLLFPSLWFEGMPMVIAEALATGLPIIASELGSMTSLVANDVNGFLVQPGSAAELGSAIIRITGDWVLRQRMQEAARQSYLQRFEPHANCLELIQIYERAIEEMPRLKSGPQ